MEYFTDTYSRQRLLQKVTYMMGGMTKDSVTASDIVQMAAESVFRQVQAGKKIENPRGYVYTTLINKTIDVLRRSATRSAVQVDITEIHSVPYESPEKKVYAEQGVAIILAAFNQLEPDQQQLMQWRFIDGLSLDEIVVALLMSEPTLKDTVDPKKTIKARIYRAKEKVKQILSESLSTFDVILQKEQKTKNDELTQLESAALTAAAEQRKAFLESL